MAQQGQAPGQTQRVPLQAAADGLPPAVDPVPPEASEATRLLCAGSYLDDAYRDAVIEELYVHEERIVAPSLGIDAARVLAHALRARRAELGWAGLVLGLWVVGLVLTEYLLLGVALPGVYLALGEAARGADDEPPAYRRFFGFLLRWTGRVVLIIFGVMLVRVAFGGAEGESVTSLLRVVLPEQLLLVLFMGGQGAEVNPFHGWAAIVTLVLVALCLGARSGQFARVLGNELHPRRFGDVASDPAERADSGRFQRLRSRIRIEQHAPLVMYHSARPFCGAGKPYDSWTLAVELRPDPDKEQHPISNRLILEAVRPLLAQLRLPSPHAVGGVRDRLRELQIDECVFLPVAGLPRRDLAPYDEGAFAAHQADAVEEGGETRRHFLRIRVGGWEEEIVTTVFVRVHTQGRMLMLEIAPHVLLPVRGDFEEADRLAHQYRHNNAFGKGVWALVRTPKSLAYALFSLGRGAILTWRTLTGGYGAALPDGPAVSVRELGSDEAGSLFQDMDVNRYLKSIQDRVANGVRRALQDAGYQTGEFAQKVVNVSGGGVFIERARGAFAVGDGNVITNQAPDTGGPTNPHTGGGNA